MQRGHTLGLGVDGAEYQNYIKELQKTDEHVYIADNTHFHNEITTQTCETFIVAKKLDILFIDDISYITVPNANKMPTTERIGKVCRDLFNLSAKYKIPVVATIQAKRRSENTQEEDIVGSESIFNSYFASQQSSRIVSINKCGEGVKFYVAKNRYGKTGSSYVYLTNYDKMQLTYVPKDTEADKDEGLLEVKKGLKHAF